MGATLTGPAFLFCRSGYQQGSAWHGWSLAMLCLEGAGFWLIMAWAEPCHASLGGCWILAQHGMGGARPCFAWRVLDSGSAWHGWSLVMLRLEGACTALRSLEGR